MKREWKKPLSTVECFEANEYVAACWGIYCDGGHGVTNPEHSYDEQAGYWGGNYETSDGDHTGSCTDITCNRVLVDADGSISFSENSSDQGWINGYWYGYDDNDQSGSISDGDTGYWTTYAADGRTWNHAGRVTAIDSTRPNHS